MSNSDTKEKLNVWIEPSLMRKIDSRVKKNDTSRATVVKEALNYFFEKDKKEEIRYEVITANLESLKAMASSLESKSEAQATLLMDAIKNQPIAVQNQLEEPKKSWWKRMFGSED
jgi:metal-responsive CopG/Arc/MetJ family transcriptional regulator